MFFEPESWTGLRSPGAVEHHLNAEREAPSAATARHSPLRSLATRIGAIVDWTGAVGERRAHRAEPKVGGDFLNERRVFILDGSKR